MSTRERSFLTDDGAYLTVRVECDRSPCQARIGVAATEDAVAIRCLIAGDGSDCTLQRRTA